MIEGEELKQLLQNGEELSQDVDMISDEEKTAIVELFNEPLKAVAKAMEKVLAKPCALGEVSADIAKASLIKDTLGEGYKLLDAKYKSGLSAFAFDVDTIKKIANILLETMPEGEEVTETELKAFGEVFSQATSALANSLAKVTDANIAIEESLGDSEMESLDENVVQLAIALSINEEVDTTIYYYITYAVYNTLFKVLKSKLPPEETKNSENKSINDSRIEETSEESVVDEESSATIQPICFEELTEDLVANQKENMNLLMDLQLQVSVELGKVKKPIKDILQFTQGTIVELDRLAGDNVDVLVSGKIIAKGEVVVVDQNFGVRITKIVLPEKRV